ncbi:MAG: SulP family inorganic anion transporter [Streptosporangiaceae bacterium]
MSVNTSATEPVAKPTAPSTLERWFPIAVWLPKYKWGKFTALDLIAAISVAALLIPESMGYASVAGLPPQIGLYAAPLALVGYALFGGSRLVVYAAAGSVAAVSAGVVGGLHAKSPSQAVTFTVALTLAAGAVFVVAGLAKMGWISNFMSKAVMAGFICAMAIGIIVGQVGHLTGIHETGSNTFQQLWSVLKNIGHWNWTATIVGLLAIALIFALQRYMKKVPAALTAVILTSVYVAIASPNIKLVKKIPRGLPSFTFPTGIHASTWGTLVIGGCVVALVGFSEGWGSVKTMARKTDSGDPDSNQEFRAFGVGLIGAGLLGGMPVTGSLSKSAAAESAGAKSQMSNIFLGVFVLLVLAFLAPLFQWLPEACLGAVVINAMWGSASPMKVVDFWKVDRVDFGLGVITGLVVLSSTLLKGMLVGILFSLIYLVFRVSFPGRADLGRDDKTGEFEARTWMHGTKEGAGNPNARPVPGVMLYRFDAPLIYSNSEAFKQTGEQFLIDAAAKGPLPKTLVIDFEEVFYADVSGAGALSSLHKYAEQYDVGISIARLHSTARETLAADGVLAEIGEDRIYDSVQAAVAAANPSKGETGQKEEVGA